MYEKAVAHAFGDVDLLDVYLQLHEMKYKRKQSVCSNNTNRPVATSCARGSQDNDPKILNLENYEYRMGQPMELTLQKNIK